ncbi:MAG: sulfatase [Planctomycetota bacterium]
MARPVAPALGLALASLLAAVPRAQQPLAGSRPNILFVFSDDHAAHAISAYGSRINRTPNLDRLADDGVLFRNAFCGNSLCGPSRAAILTGKHSHENGFLRNGNVFDGSQVTFPKLLQRHGYRTAIVGKWHLSSDPEGFDYWRVLPGQGRYYNPDFLGPDGRERVHGHATDVTTDLAIGWLDRWLGEAAGDAGERPFLLMCQHKAPHREWMPAPEDLALYRDQEIPEPATLFDDYAGRTRAARATEMEIARHMYLHYDLMVPPTDAERAHLEGPDRWFDGIMDRLDPEQRAVYEAAFAEENEAFRRAAPTGRELVRWKYQRYIKNYLRCVHGVDRSVGRLLDWLRAHPDVEANTIVIYSSDQGFYLGDHGWYDKRWMYDESLRMPLLVRWPGHVGAGREVTALVQNIDYGPTFLDLAGVPIPPDVHGRSLVPLLAGEAPGDWRDAIYYHYYESQATHMVPAHYGVRTDRYKLIRYYEPQWDEWELFDLQQDPDELRSVADDPAYAEVRRGLEQRLAALRAEYRDDTGTLGDGAFPITAGIARTLRTDTGWQVWANATGGYLLHTGDRAGTTVLTTALRALPGRQLRNGHVLLSGSADPRAALLRVQVAFGSKRLRIAGPGDMQERAGVELPAAALADGAAVPLRITFDPAAHTVVAEAAGRRVEAPLPPEWRALHAWGYGASNAETAFTELELETK